MVLKVTEIEETELVKVYGWNDKTQLFEHITMTKNMCNYYQIGNY